MARFRRGELCGQATVTVYLAASQEAQEVTLTFRLEGTVAEKLKFEIRPFWKGVAAVFYDSPDYAAGFTVSTLQPCEVNDPHRDCVEAGVH